MSHPCDCPKITVLIPCKDEQLHIADCIDSAWLLADEVLIADSGSTDSTLRIAGGRGCRVIQRELIDLGNFKNWAIPQATHPWVFVLDADERISVSLANEVRQVLAEHPRYDGYWVYRRNHFMGHPVRFGSWGRDRVIRLFRRDLGRYYEYTDHSEIRLPRRRVGKLDHRLIHFTCGSYEQFLRKMDRYTMQQARRWFESGKAPSRISLVANGPLRFAREYILHGGFLDGAAGFQIAALTGFYSFLKQARLWQLHHGRQPLEAIGSPRLNGPIPDVRADRCVNTPRLPQVTYTMSKAPDVRADRCVNTPSPPIGQNAI
jgi:glycosyltransferase involved in cell wall biosynthesis